MEKLLKEERLIVRCLSIYGCLRKEQLLRLIAKKGRETSLKIYEGLKKRQYIEEFDGGYVRLDPRTDPSEKTISAFWVLLKYIDKIDKNNHYMADYPSEIFFLRDNMMYEIICLYDNEEYLLKTLFLENRTSSTEEEDSMKYIIIVPTAEAIEKCVATIPQKAIENGQVLFAVLEYEDDADEPTVEFYRC